MISYTFTYSNLTDNEIVKQAVKEHLEKRKYKVKKRLTPLCPRCLKNNCKPKVKHSRINYGDWICTKCNYIIRQKEW
jgi:ribosomal protein L37AE/L43A